MHIQSVTQVDVRKTRDLSDAAPATCPAKLWMAMRYSASQSGYWKSDKVASLASVYFPSQSVDSISLNSVWQGAQEGL